ncbi:MAG TPA: protein kinase [Myxococcota bacterium]|jgi:type IV secretory pathway TrbD component|nr:protein kinase [Myxococcota bacterium]
MILTTVGDVLAGRFELIRLAGAGGMGDVYLARDRQGGALVAVKVLQAGPHVAARFAREARALAELRHPGIVRYVAHGTVAEGRPYLAMEWLDGEDLAARLDRGPLPLADGVALARRVAEALGAAHARGVVHRDLKPANLFLPGGDVRAVKLLDFGIARLGGGGGGGFGAGSGTPAGTGRGMSRATRTGVMIGTPGYMAPEQARGERGVDARSDLFALGCVLHECLTGVPAFSGDHLVAVFAKVLFSDPPPVRELRPDAPPALEALVARLLAKEPTSRPADAAAVVRDLDAVDLDDAEPAAAAAFPLRVALGEQEQRRLFVVLAGGRGEPASLSPSPPDAALASTQIPLQRGELWERLRAVAQAHEARIEGLADGSVVATLAAPGAATDAATRAARCALAVRAELPHAPMGLATGRGVMGATLPFGEVIDRAVSLLRAPAPAAPRVRLDEATAGLLDLRFAVEGDAHGLSLLDEREATDEVRRLLGRPSPCVGRDRELAILAGTLAEAVNDDVARAVLVTAPPGVGKSRLRHEFLRQFEHRDDPPQVWLARGDPLGAGSAFVLLGQLIRRTAGVREGEPNVVRTRKLRARVARQVPAAEAPRVSAFLGELCGVAFADDDSVQLRAARRDPQLMSDQLTRAFLDFLEAELSARPLLVVLEDLHWGDLPSVKFLDAALRQLAQRPLMVLATARPEVHEAFPRLWAERGVQEIRLAELSRKAGQRLVRQVLGDGVGDDVVERIVARSSGNAFYLEELIRVVADGRSDALPESVLAMAQVRYEALEPDARRVLRAAAVFGERFWKQGVCALLGHRAHAADEWLPILVERELVERRPEGRFRDADEYVFRHALLHDAALAALTPSDSALGHRLSADWLERAGETDALLLAEHRERAGDATAAVSWYRRAAEQALDGGDLAGALQRAERGLRAGAGGDDRFGLLALQMEARKWGSFGRDGADRHRALLAELPRDSAYWYRAAAELSLTLGGALEVARALLEGEPEGTLMADWVVCAARTASQLFIMFLDVGAEPLYDKLERIAPSLAARDPALTGWLLQCRAFRAGARGETDQAKSLFEAAAVSFEEAGDQRNAMAQRADRLYTLADLGLNEMLVEEGSALMVECQRLGLYRLIQVVARPLLSGLSRTGRQDVTAMLFERALAMVPVGSSERVFIHLVRGHFLLRAGDLEAGPSELKIGLDSAAAAGAVFGWLDLRSMRAELSLALGRPDEAVQATEGEVPPPAVLGDGEVGRPRFYLARIRALRAAGRLDDARAAAAAGRACVLERATHILDPELHRSSLVNVPDRAEILALADELCGLL